VLVAALGTNHAKPFGPEMQVKQMFCGRAARAQHHIPDARAILGAGSTRNTIEEIFKILRTDNRML